MSSDASRPDGGPFHATIRFGRVAGIEVGANWSWLIVVGLIVASLASSVFPDAAPGLGDGAYVAMAVVATVLFFTSLVLHELGHALVARREGVRIEGITLWVFGGVARFSGMFPSAGAELRIAVAGPVVSVIVCAAALGFAELPLPATVEEVARWLGEINLMLVLFNMLPALPLDGGRVLRALLWLRKGDFVAATRIAASLGNVFGFVFIAGGVMLFLAGAPGGLWFALIGWFLTVAAGAESQLATMRGAFAGLTTRDAMSPDPVTVDRDAVLTDFFDTVFSRSRHSSYPVVREGRVQGLLPYGRAAAVPVDRWDDVTAGERMLGLAEVPVADAGASLADVAGELVTGGSPAALVTAEGELAGIVSRTDVARMLDLRRRLQAP